jgi:hypothetical protein
MSNAKTSLKDTFKSAALAASIGALGVAAVGPLGLVAGSVLGGAAAMGFNFARKKATVAAEPVAVQEIEISIETGAPVKAMKQIRLRR